MRREEALLLPNLNLSSYCLNGADKDHDYD
jgi:hypothetical protein